MKSENYFYSDDSSGDMTSYEEQLLLNYDDYLESGFTSSVKAQNHYNLELGDLDEFLEEDLESEYDENDWEEEEDDLSEEDENTEGDPETFIM
ncbi:hypothetical protein [Flavobacterium sp. ACN6]|uniref:hypothetical protein n=1 Tax=Flavobacterium sp. ACN6 TaxID=1920426 RepID=UPI000BB39BA1|nr:hypothetical protein [Flavobacterium sp. ACN6]PBJ10110.1 hypothetical protein BSF42_31790 [Flavobacterium sp. ACN6]